MTRRRVSKSTLKAVSTRKSEEYINWSKKILCVTVCRIAYALAKQYTSFIFVWQYNPEVNYYQMV